MLPAQGLTHAFAEAMVTLLSSVVVRTLGQTRSPRYVLISPTAFLGSLHNPTLQALPVAAHPQELAQQECATKGQLEAARGAEQQARAEAAKACEAREAARIQANEMQQVKPVPPRQTPDHVPKNMSSLLT